MVESVTATRISESPAAIKESIVDLKGRSIVDFNYLKNKPFNESKTETISDTRIIGLEENEATKQMNKYHRH